MVRQGHRGRRAGGGDKGRDTFAAGNKAILLVTGGSLGADKLNQVVREALPELLQQYTVLHICGPGKVSGAAQPGYMEFEYVAEAVSYTHLRAHET